MPQDVFNEVVGQSWFGRIGNAIAGVAFGGLFIVISIALLFWNEGRAVKTAKSLAEGAAVVVSLDGPTTSPANEGKLVHFTGSANTTSAVGDPVFGISASALRLKRDVQLYQWKEQEHSEQHTKLGGASETFKTYTYRTDWSDRPINSSNFHVTQGHTNPPPAFESNTFTAPNITVGDFALPSDLSDQIDNFSPLPANSDTLGSVPAPLQSRLKLDTDGFYLGTDTTQPQVGDARIHFSIAKPGLVSVVATQTGHTLEPYIAKAGGQVCLLSVGDKSADLMFKAAELANERLTWLLRGIGFFLSFLGVAFLLVPLRVVADVIPLLGDLVGAGVGVIAFLVSATLSLVTIAVAWIVFRPVLGIGLLVVAGAVVFGIMRLAGKRRAARIART